MSVLMAMSALSASRLATSCTSYRGVRNGGLHMSSGDAAFLPTQSDHMQRRTAGADWDWTLAHLQSRSMVLLKIAAQHPLLHCLWSASHICAAIADVQE